MSEQNPLMFYHIEDCDFCNCTGKIEVKHDNGETEEEVCPMCDGRGALKRRIK